MKRKTKQLLTIITPCYNEEQTVELFYNELKKNLNKLNLDYEILFVNDGSKDKTVENCKKLKNKDKKIKIISFSRNFGKEAAMYAGLVESKGDYVVIMDTDLQDPPALLPRMLNTVTKEGYDSAATYRVTRKGEPKIRSFFARIFYKLINKFIDVEIVDGARDYRIMTRQMVDSILSMKEYHRFSKGIFAWVGYKTKYIEYENVERVAGETKWSFWKLFGYAIEGVVAFTTAPLRLATIVGAFTSLLGFVFMIIVFVRAITIGNAVAGYPSLICIILLLGGMQLLFLGIFGEYLAKTYMESKHRPVYIIKEID